MFETLLLTLLIFSLRIVDVSVGTVRVMYAVQGRRLIAAALGLVESAVFIFAVRKVLQDPHVGYIPLIGYASGYAVGTLVGVTVEKLIASGWILLRVISRDHPDAIAATLRGKGLGVTTIRGEGREGEIDILFVVTLRKRANEMIRDIQAQDATAFITIEPVVKAIRGIHPGNPAAVIK